MSNLNGIHNTLARKEGLSLVTPARHTLLRNAVTNLSRRNIDQSICELMNEALARLVLLAFERDDDGRLCNVDGATGRVLVPLPWGKLGYAKWGLAPSEANAMRRIMLIRQREGVPLFSYDRSRRAWFVNLDDYPDGVRILRQFKEWEITVTEYRAARVQVVGAPVGR